MSTIAEKVTDTVKDIIALLSNTSTSEKLVRAILALQRD
jgi:hypothetical protein